MQAGDRGRPFLQTKGALNSQPFPSPCHGFRDHEPVVLRASPPLLPFCGAQVLQGMGSDVHEASSPNHEPPCLCHARQTLAEPLNGSLTLDHINWSSGWC